jgi:hypothetical protein
VARTRLGLLTVDFEAFAPETIEPWIAAMELWSRAATAHELPFTFFLSLEHLAVLRGRDPNAYRRFAMALGELSQAECELHVHNHCLFDWSNGIRSVDIKPFSNPVEGYPRRASMWYDVVRRNGRPWGEWAAELRRVHEEVLADAGRPVPERVAFRAGGWDTGTTPEDWVQFVSGLDEAGFAVDSSALSRLSGGAAGQFSTSAYRLTDELVELAPCIWMDCGAAGSVRGLPSPPSAVLRQRSAVRLPVRDGLMVVVLHFDHLFHSEQARYALLGDRGAVGARIERFMRATTWFFGALRLRACGIERAAEFAG